MAIAFIAERGGATIGAFGMGVPLAITTAGTVAVGNTLVLCITSDNGGVGGVAPTLVVTDPRGNTWTQRGVSVINPAGQNTGCVAWVYTCPVVNAYTNGDLVTVDCSPNTSLACWWLQEFSSVSSAAASVAAVATTGTGTSITGAITPAVAGRLVVALAAIEGPTSPTGDADTTDGPWSTISTLNNGGGSSTSNTLAMQHKLVTGGSAQSWTAVLPLAKDWASLLVCLDESAGAAATGNFFLILGV